MQTLIDELTARRTQRYERERRTSSQEHPRASNVTQCAREMYYQITAGESREPHSVELLQRFHVGSESGKYVTTELLADGWDVTEQESPFRIEEDGLVICTGHIDGRVSRNGDGRGTIFEAKSLNPNVWNRIESAHDFWRMGSFWKRYPVQLLLYCYHYSEPGGLFILHDCLGHLKFIPIMLDDWLDETEAALLRCRKAAWHAACRSDAGVGAPYDPPAMIDDLSVCRGCWAHAAGLCFPAMDFGAGAKLIDDAELAIDLDRMSEIREDGEEYKGLEERLKKRMKASGPGQYIAGDYSISVVEKPRKALELPADVRKQYTVEGSAFYTEWSKTG